MFILELNVTNKTHTSEKKLLESGAVIRSFRDRGGSHSIGSSEQRSRRRSGKSS
jgi:hypothetical protein